MKKDLTAIKDDETTQASDLKKVSKTNKANVLELKSLENTSTAIRDGIKKIKKTITENSNENKS